MIAYLAVTIATAALAISIWLWFTVRAAHKGAGHTSLVDMREWFTARTGRKGAGNPSLVDMREFSALHPDLKRAYNVSIVDTIMPAIAELTNAAYEEMTPSQRKEGMARLEREAKQVAGMIRGAMDDIEDTSRALRSFRWGKAVNSVVAATMKPIKTT